MLLRASLTCGRTLETISSASDSAAVHRQLAKNCTRSIYDIHSTYQPVQYLNTSGIATTTLFLSSVARQDEASAEQTNSYISFRSIEVISALSFSSDNTSCCQSRDTKYCQKDQDVVVPGQLSKKCPNVTPRQEATGRIGEPYSTVTARRTRNPSHEKDSVWRHCGWSCQGQKPIHSDPSSPHSPCYDIGLG